MAIIIFFQVLTGGKTLDPINLLNLVNGNAYVLILAIGMVLVIIAGHIDLSVGSVAAFAGIIVAISVNQWHWPWPFALLLGLGVGALVGAWQGFWVAYVGVPAFIVTLAGMLVFKGLALALLQGQSVGPFPATFQAVVGLHPGLLPDAGTLHPTSMLIGIALAFALVYASARGRAREQSHGIEVEPYASSWRRVSCSPARCSTLPT